MGDHSGMLGKLGGHQRGPAPGCGRNVNGQPWAGLVEDTPALWVGWIVEASKRLGRPVPAALTVGATRVRIVGRQLTFGTRHYFLCPACGRRCEALYWPGRGLWACRQCLHLGYRSQASRAGSAYAWLDEVFDGDRRLWRRYRVDETLAGDMLMELRNMIGERVEAALSQIGVEDRYGDASPDRYVDIRPVPTEPARIEVDNGM